MADVLFCLYLVFIVVVCGLCYTKPGKNLFYEYLAFRDTQRYMHSKGLRWPPREGLD